MTNSKGDINNKTLDNLNIFYTNARSVRNKWNEFISYFYSEDIDIACITETWISETYFGDNLDSFNIIGYNKFICQRDSCGGEERKEKLGKMRGPKKIS